MAFRNNLRLYKNLQQTTHRKKVIKEGPKPRPEELNDGEPRSSIICSALTRDTNNDDSDENGEIRESKCIKD